MRTQAQSTLEFVFVMVAIMFLIYGTVQVFRWVGMDMAQRRWAYDNSLTSAADSGDMRQLTRDPYRPSRINAFPNGVLP